MATKIEMPANPGHTIQHGGHLLLHMEQQMCGNRCGQTTVGEARLRRSDLSISELREQGSRAV
jgi:hypothetical protein